jgi:O-acetyl-ADP-ribose deacetylase (regulator of RNase III)
MPKINSKIITLTGGGKIIEVYGDLMIASNSLAHCVSACLHMGKGIAVNFRNTFGHVDELKSQNASVGNVAILSCPHENRYIYYLVTKLKYYQKPTYNTLRSSIQKMVQHMEANNVASVSIPELGCGLDGLQWSNVLKILQEEFDKTNIDVTCYHYTMYH